MTAEQREEIVERFVAGESIFSLADRYSPEDSEAAFKIEIANVLRDRLRRLRAIEAKALEIEGHDLYGECQIIQCSRCAKMAIAREILAAGDEP